MQGEWLQRLALRTTHWSHHTRFTKSLHWTYKISELPHSTRILVFYFSTNEPMFDLPIFCVHAACYLEVRLGNHQTQYIEDIRFAMCPSTSNVFNGMSLMVAHPYIQISRYISEGLETGHGIVCGNNSKPKLMLNTVSQWLYKSNSPTLAIYYGQWFGCSASLGYHSLHMLHHSWFHPDWFRSCSWLQKDFEFIYDVAQPCHRIIFTLVLATYRLSALLPRATLWNNENIRTLAVRTRALGPYFMGRPQAASQIP